MQFLLTERLSLHLYRNPSPAVCILQRWNHHTVETEYKHISMKKEWACRVGDDPCASRADGNQALAHR